MRIVIIFGLVAALLCQPVLSQDTSKPSLGLGGISESVGSVSSREIPNVIFGQDQLSQFASSRLPAIAAARAGLAQRVRARLGSMQDDVDVYKGCKLDVYTKVLTYEHGSASRDAADFAIYSALSSDDVAKSARQAAVDILVKWSSVAEYLVSASDNDLSGFCDEMGQASQDARFAVGLTFGRGIPNLVIAYEVLRAQNAITSDQSRRIGNLFNALYILEWAAMNYRAKNSNLECNKYNNHVSIQIAALSSLAALRGDHGLLRDIAVGSSGRMAISLSTQISKSIYQHAENLLNCFSNSANSKMYYQNSDVEDGEIVDRYRAKPNQTFGYPMFSLEHMLLSALILQRKGINLTAVEKGRLEAALHYYGDLLAQSETGRGLTEKFRQYRGKNVFGGQHTVDGSDFMLNPFIIGAALFPEDKQTKALIHDFFLRDGGFSHSPSIYLPLLMEIQGK